MQESVMIICHCHAVNDRQIKEAVANGTVTMRGLYQELKVGRSCGRCVPQTRRLLENTLLHIAEPTSRKVA
jgi:bacterioferritin-associated ferredoxin